MPGPRSTWSNKGAATPKVSEHLFIKPTTKLSHREARATTSSGERLPVSRVVKSAKPRQGQTLPSAPVMDAPSSSMALPVNSTTAPRSTAAFSASLWGSRADSAAFWVRSAPAPI